MNHSITIKGQQFNLTTAEAKNLFDELAAVFGKSRVIENHYHTTTMPELRIQKVDKNRIVGPTFSMRQ